MKKQTLLVFALLSVFLMSCSTNMMGDNSKLYDNGWELEYITGPRIAFEGLFPDEKPVISFNKSTNMVTGSTGCNGYNTQYKMSGKMISFEVPATTTMRYCGEGEAVFLKTMKEVKSYRMSTDGKLELLMNDIVMMRFKKTM